MKKKPHKLALFVPMYIATLSSPAWRALPYGARCLYLALKRRYNRTRQGAVFLSARTAAKEIGCDKTRASRWLRTLEDHGFIVETAHAVLGGDGGGKSALYRLTDEPFQDQPPTNDFLRRAPKKQKARTQKADTVYA